MLTLTPFLYAAIFRYVIMKINFFGDVKSQMIRSILFSALFCLFLLIPLASNGAEISGPEVRVLNNDIFVTAGLVLDEKNLINLKSGTSKKVIFYIDLFRVWKTWPDEFITGKKIEKTVEVNPIKDEFIATSMDGATHIEKRFKSIESMLRWVLNIRDLKLAHVKELERSEYFVKITVESKLRELPPLLRHIIFFVPETEFKVTKDSLPLTVGSER